MTRLGWIGKTEAVALARQCVLAGVARATVYAQQKAKLRIGAGMQDDEALKRLIDEEYTRHPFFGSRKMVVYLKRCEHQVNRKRVQRLMRSMGLAGMAPGPHTSKAHPKHKTYPYLLRGVPIVAPNQVWSTDITLYLEGVAIRYRHTRRGQHGYHLRLTAWDVDVAPRLTFAPYRDRTVAEAPFIVVSLH